MSYAARKRATIRLAVACAAAGISTDDGKLMFALVLESSACANGEAR